MEELLKNISAKDLEKLKMLFSIIPGNETKEVVTLRVFIDEYKNFIQHSRSSSYLRSVDIALNYLVDYFSNANHRPGLQKSISSISLKDVEDFLLCLQQKVKKPVSASRGEGYRVYYRNLKAAFNKAKEWGYLKENYFTRVKLPKRQKLAPVFINSDQLSAISKQIKNEIVRDVVVFAFYTGMRLDEIVNLRWKNVDLKNRIITVGDESFTTKGRNQRYIPISEEAEKAIENVELRMQNEKKNNIMSINTIVPAQNFVFCKEDGTKFTGNYFSRRFKKACIAAGLDKAIHFHSLRHSFASNLAQKGVPLYTIKELLGHSSVSTTEIYSHLNMDSLREAISKFDVRSSKYEEKENANNDVKIFRINSREK